MKNENAHNRPDSNSRYSSQNPVPNLDESRKKLQEKLARIRAQDPAKFIQPVKVVVYSPPEPEVPPKNDSTQPLRSPRQPAQRPSTPMKRGIVIDGD